MALTFTDGTITTTAAEQDLFDITADRYFASYAFLHNLIAGDTVEFKVYIRDENATVQRVYLTQSYSGVQNDPAVYFATLPAKNYRVTVKRTAGTDRSITWLRAES